MTATASPPSKSKFGRATLLLATVAASAVGAGACARVPSTAAAHVQRITVKATNALRFVPSTLVVRTGTVDITLVDTGAYPHDLHVPGLHAVSKTVTGFSGQRTTHLVLRIAKPGRYPFYCDYHSTAGMVGTIVARNG